MSNFIGVERRDYTRTSQVTLTIPAVTSEGDGLKVTLSLDEAQDLYKDLGVAAFAPAKPRCAYGHWVTGYGTTRAVLSCNWEAGHIGSHNDPVEGAWM